MGTIKNFFTKYSNIFYGILSAVLIVSWVIFSGYQYIFILKQSHTMIITLLHLYVVFMPSFGIFYFLGEYRIYKYCCIIEYNDVSILDESFLKK